MNWILKPRVYENQQPEGMMIHLWVSISTFTVDKTPELRHVGVMSLKLQ